ncbi:hypothetical protein DE146DRAFT_662539 [Phaeosphaeria sp. MPI-PUGE-AT-0046c]|nr:hypothetical protein DE146DRAFT_662539 [Phaeosphaeria sp. MPI-PUGE-AT-0046c]
MGRVRIMMMSGSCLCSQMMMRATIVTGLVALEVLCIRMVVNWRTMTRAEAWRVVMVRTRLDPVMWQLRVSTVCDVVEFWL